MSFALRLGNSPNAPVALRIAPICVPESVGYAVSTQHNILTVIALATLSQQLQEQGDEGGANAYREAAEGIPKGIDAQLVVRDGGLEHFRQGVGDEVVPLDTQALGIVYARFLGDDDLAKQVYEYAQQNFAIDGRSITLSSKKASYNMTYEAKGPFSGYRPYIGKRAPDVSGFEGTAEMRFVSSFLGQPTETLDASMNSWRDVTREQGLAPLGAAAPSPTAPTTSTTSGRPQPPGPGRSSAGQQKTPTGRIHHR